MSVNPILEGKHEPVAIVGMGCRWSGGVKDSPGLWQMLKNNQTGWKEFKEPSFPAEGFYHANQDRPGSVRTRGGFLCDEDARLFDHSFFGIMGREVETMDPSQRKLLEVVYEAFENAGETWDSISGSQTGVYIGNFALDHLLIQSREWDYPKPYAATGAETSILANRISYVFNLHGPSLATNTACSSSMYALHLAVSAIRNGDCDGAIVAAANWISDPSMQIVLDKLGALSPTSRCHTFDAAADGYARGEGFAAIYLKKSSLAVLNGLPIRAMIRGTAVNANGKTGGITRPSARGQEAAIRKAYENAGHLDFADTTYFECHGTGTQAGDPLEVAAVGNVFASTRSDNAEDRLLIGSIKPNLGHTEGASALASVMKVVLSLEAGEIPPTYGVEKLNPNIDFDGAKVLVVKDFAVPWPEGKTRRASINSFGFGGANGHCVIDHVHEVLPGYVKPGVIVNRQSNGASNPSSNGFIPNGHSNGNGSATLDRLSTNLGPSKTASARAPTRQLVLLPFSAHNTSSLQLNINTLSRAIGQWSLADIAYTLGSKRSRMQQRTFRIVDKGNVELGLAGEKRIFTSPMRPSNVAYVFTGQGAQWHAMGARLFEYGVFRTTISYLDLVLQEFPSCPEWTIASTLLGEYEPDHIQSPTVSQVACTAVQIAIVDLLDSWSVRPIAVAGHSSGEMAAAYASGHTTAAEAITTAYCRGRAVSKSKKKGAMLAIGLGVDEASGYLEGKQEQVRIAAMNSPGSVTLSGDVDAIQLVAEQLTRDGVFNRMLRTSGNAYHSHHMLAIGSDYIDMLNGGLERIEKLGLNKSANRYPSIPWVSSVEPDKVMAEADVGSHYWRKNLESPVRFAQAITKMLNLCDSTTIDLLVEIGPHGALKGPIDQIVKAAGKSSQYVPSLQRDEDDRSSLLQLAGTLFATNADIDLAAVNSVDISAADGTSSLVHGCIAVDLPTYQYTYGPVTYYESRMSKEYRLRNHIRHDLLGSEVLGSSKLQPQWRNVLRPKEITWLSDHRLIPDAVFPAAGFIALGIEAATRVYQDLPHSLGITGYSFRDVDISAALRIPEDDYGIEIITSLDRVDATAADSPAWVKFTVTSVARDSQEWTQHCTGKVKVNVSPPAARDRMNEEMDPRFPSSQEWYNKFTELGLGYNETFQTISNLKVDPHRNRAKATVSLQTAAGTVPGGESYYPLHPAALDATFQLAIISFFGGQLEKANAAYVPVHISELYLKAGVQYNSATAIAHGSLQGSRNAFAQLQMAGPDGDIFFEVESMRFTNFKELKVNGMQPGQTFSSPFARLVWKPDIRNMTDSQVRRLFPPPAENAKAAAALEVVEMICCLVAFEIYATFVAGDEQLSPRGDIRHWLAWIKKIVEEDKREQMVRARSLSADQRCQLLLELYEQAGESPEAKAAKLLHENAAEILNERRTGIDVLISNKLLTALYEIGYAIAGSHPQLSNIMDCLAHANPNARILEIGAGTGAATRAAMKVLVSPDGIKRYADYTFTDISAGFLTSAKEMLAGYRDVNYAVLDIEKNPMEHGYEPVYDVVLACEAIHATESMDRTLAHCRSLLKPGGKLVLVETTRMRVLLGFLYGTLTGYWQSDDRTEGPFMSLETWQRRLIKTGFSGVDLHVDDYDAPHNTTSVLVTTRVEEQAPQAFEQSTKLATNTVYLIQDNDTPWKILEQIVVEFELRGATCTMVSLHSAEATIPKEARVVVLLDRHNDLFDADAHRLRVFQYLARSIKSMVWLTAGGIIRGQDPRGAFMSGLLRVIATENPAGRFLSINAENAGFNHIDGSLARAIVDREASLQAEVLDEDSIDSEFAWQDGYMWVSRVIPDPGLTEYAENLQTPSQQGFQSLPIGSQGSVRAVFETSGVLNSLYFRPYTELLQPLPNGYIDVKVDAAGLNLQGVKIAAGRTNEPGSSPWLEYSGVVTRVGGNVAGLSIGDRVYGMGKSDFGNYQRVPAVFTQKLAPSIDPTEAASVPFAFMSAVYALEHVGQLRKGQKALIQSATGDIGLAAIQIAQARGVDVFALVERSDQASFLAETVGIPTDRTIFTQDPEALSRVTRSSSGKETFDAVLVTTAVRDLSPYRKALAPLGHLINLGGTEVLEVEEVKPARGAIIYSTDLGMVLENNPQLGAELMETVHELYRTSRIVPIRPLTVRDVSELDQSLLKFSRDTQIGKTVISFQNPSSALKLVQQPRVATFDPEARYVITGGLGGLGRSIVRWMADRGARDFVLLSRRGPNTPAAQVLLNDMKDQGVHVEAIACDVSKHEQVTQAIAAVTRSGRPIKGVVHAVLSLSDLSFDKLTIDEWKNGTVAKTLGSINLHEAMSKQPLDFFVMLTSTETVWAPATQAAYIAADNFATYFARYRRRLGLPASTVSYGFIRDLGSDYRATSHGTADMYARNLAVTMTERQALNALEPAFLDNTQTGDTDYVGRQHDPLSAATLFTSLSPLDLAALSSANTPRWHQDGRVSLLMRAVADVRRHVITSGEQNGLYGENSLSKTAKLRRAFDEVIKAGPESREAAIELVVHGISIAIAEMLFVDAGNINPNKTVAEHGVDSLIAAELRNWFHQALRVDLKNLLDSETSIRALAEHIVDKSLGVNETDV
ncbi:hypothetical protein F4861DRAFT_542029 [Xylaria intraflava]|nr:hypothetical protein F4861DRAFT_542029 [Xylaria intraflava]